MANSIYNYNTSYPNPPLSNVMRCYPFSHTLATGVFTRIIKNKALTGFPGLPADPRLPRTPGGPCHSIKGRDTTSFRFKNDHFLS